MSQYGFSSQGTTITITGTGGTIGPFGVTDMKNRRNYSNADTTTTYSTVSNAGSAWDEHVPITRGVLIDVDVPFKIDANIDQIDYYFDQTCYGSNPSPMAFTITYPLSEGTDTGFCMLESYEENFPAKDAIRIRFTLKVTGPLTIN